MTERLVQSQQQKATILHVLALDLDVPHVTLKWDAITN